MDQNQEVGGYFVPAAWYFKKTLLALQAVDKMLWYDHNQETFGISFNLHVALIFFYYSSKSNCNVIPKYFISL